MAITHTDTDRQTETDVNKLHRWTERDTRIAHYFAFCWGLGYVWAI